MDSALALSLQKGRNAFFHRSGTDDAGASALNQYGTCRGVGKIGDDVDGAKLICPSVFSCHVNDLLFLYVKMYMGNLIWSHPAPDVLRGHSPA